MNIIRTSKFILKFSNSNKKSKLKQFIVSYKELVNKYLTVLFLGKFDNVQFNKQFINLVDSDSTYRVKQLALRHAYLILKRNRRNIKPVYKSNSVILDQNRNGEIFQCNKCSYTEDADYNASKNIRNIGLNLFAGTPTG